MEEYGFEFEMVYQNKLTLSNPMKLVEADLKVNLLITKKTQSTNGV